MNSSRPAASLGMTAYTSQQQAGSMRLGSCLVFLLIAALLLERPIMAQGSVLEKQVDLTSGLVAYWKADGSAEDAVRKLEGRMWSAKFAPGMRGQAFDLGKPSYNTAVIIGEPALNENYAALTIAAWVNAREHGRTIHGDMGRTVISRTEDGGFALRVKNGTIELDLRTEAEDRRTQWLMFPGAQVPLHTWVLIVATYDGQTARAYLDGKALPKSLPVTGRIKKTTLPSARLMIGNEPGINPSNVHDPFGGGIGWRVLLDEIRFYNRALNAAEVAALYEDTKPAVAYTPPPPPPPSPPPPPRPPPTTKEWLRSLVSRAAAGRNLDPLFYFLCVWFLALLIGKGAWRSFLGSAAILTVVWTTTRLLGCFFIFNWGAPTTMQAQGLLLAFGYGVWLAGRRLWRRKHGVRVADARVPRTKGRLWQMLWGGIIACVITSLAVVMADVVFIRLGPFGLMLCAILGLPHVALLGAIGGAIAHDCYAPDTSAVLRLVVTISAGLAMLSVGLMLLPEM